MAKRGITPNNRSETPASPPMTAHETKAADVEAPKLADIEVLMGEPEEISEAMVLERFYAELIDALPREAVHQSVAVGDVVTLDTIAYVDGQLMPYSAHNDVEMVIEPIAHLPGFAEELLGKNVGDVFSFSLVLPSDYEAEEMRGKEAVFSVAMKSAFRVPNLHDDDAYKVLERGETISECMDAIVTTLDEELADALLLEAQDKVLRAFSSRVQMHVKDEWINNEIAVWWQNQEEGVLKSQGADVEQRNASLHAWTHDESNRNEARHRILLSAGLSALEREEGLEFDEHETKRLLIEVGKSAGLRSSAVRKEATPEMMKEIERVARHRQLVGHVMANVRVVFADN